MERGNEKLQQLIADIPKSKVPYRNAKIVQAAIRYILSLTPIGSCRPMSANIMISILVKGGMPPKIAAKLPSQIRKGAVLHDEWKQAFATKRFLHQLGRPVSSSGFEDTNNKVIIRAAPPEGKMNISMSMPPRGYFPMSQSPSTIPHVLGAPVFGKEVITPSQQQMFPHPRSPHFDFISQHHHQQPHPMMMMYLKKTPHPPPLRVDSVSENVFEEELCHKAPIRTPPQCVTQDRVPFKVCGPDVDVSHEGFHDSNFNEPPHDDPPPPSPSPSPSLIRKSRITFEEEEEDNHNSSSNKRIKVDRSTYQPRYPSSPPQCDNILKNTENLSLSPTILNTRTMKKMNKEPIGRLDYYSSDHQHTQSNDDTEASSKIRNILSSDRSTFEIHQTISPEEEFKHLNAAEFDPRLRRLPLHKNYFQPNNEQGYLPEMANGYADMGETDGVSALLSLSQTRE